MKKILIIEDSSQLQALYSDTLTKKGFEVAYTSTSQGGMTMLSKDKPDLVLLDIILPGGGNGFDVLELMKKDPRLADIPVIILTNLDSEEKTARKIGVTDYIVKSNVPFPEIINKIVKLLA